MGGRLLTAAVAATTALALAAGPAVAGAEAGADDALAALAATVGDRSAAAPDAASVDAAVRRLDAAVTPDETSDGYQTMSASSISRQAAYVDTYRDTCDDGYGDLHSTDIIDDTSGYYGFMFSTCPGSKAAFADTTMMWLLDLDFDAYFEYAVSTFFDSHGDYRIGVLDVSSPYESQWTLVYSGAATWDRPASYNGGHLAVGAVPWHALRYTDEFLFDSRLYTSDDRYDELPEVNESYLLWPYSCEQTVWRQATVRTEPGRTTELAAELSALGLDVTSVAAGVGTLAVSPVTAEQRRLLAGVDGVVAVTRSQVVERTAVNDPEPTSWALTQMRAEAGWAVRGSAPVRVAVVDDGVDATRPDLVGRIAAGRDAVHGYPLAANTNSDRGGHGTAVTGVIAATRGNAVEVAGMNPGATIVPYRVADASGCISEAGLVAALDDIATRRTADVVNISLGGAFDAPALRDAVARVLQAGIPIIAASGNDAASSARYPAAYPGVIAVGATGSDGAVAPYSNRGRHVLLVAPGGQSEGSRARDIATLGDRDTIDYVSGTSFSAPYVTGAVSLYLGIKPGTAPAELASKLARTSVDIAPAGRDDASGYGRLDLEGFLRAAGGSTVYPTPRARDIASTCDDRQQQRFSDTVGTTHEYPINCVAGWNITAGKTPTTFDPSGSLTQGQTATFLVNTLEAADVALPQPVDACSETDIHAVNVERLIAAGIVPAPSDRRCLNARFITRELMASWTRGGLAFGGVTSADPTDWYRDDDTSRYEPHINQITAIGVVTGKGGGLYGPTETLTRGQMATFLARTLDALIT